MNGAQEGCLREIATGVEEAGAMPQWEYLQVYAPHSESRAHWVDSRGKSGECAKMKIGGYGWTYNLAPFLNQLGAEGWELVAKDQDVLLLKRPKP